MIRRALAALSILCGAWALFVWSTGGGTWSVAGLRVSSAEPFRPLLVASALAILYLVLARGAGMRRDWRAARHALTPPVLAVVLSFAVLVVALANNAWNVGGSDSYSYMSQADLWLTGDLHVPIPLAHDAPWPNAMRTFTQFGYRRVPGMEAIAPSTGAGLPLLMAAFKAVGGHAAAFLVVPLAGALLVWTTFVIGSRLGTRELGLGGAWLVATSPTFLMMGKAVMSDVPAAALWALATAGLLGTSVLGAIGAGLSASVAILVRPNLVVMAAIMGLWILVDATRPARWRRAIAFGLAALPGCLAVAAINRWLFGSALSSGYGELATLFSLANVPVTVTRYSGWLLATQTPVVFAGMVVLVCAPARVWPTTSARMGARLLAGVLVAVWLSYVAYSAFDAWWFLRFLLPSWPAMCLGTAAALLWLLDGRVWRGRALAAAAIVTLGLYGIWVTHTRGVFPGDEGERRYATIAKLVERQTESSAMVLAASHAAAVRYYAGRETVRFDELDSAWLDRTADWLAQQGRHPYLLIEDWEMPSFEQRFGPRNRLGSLRFAPALVYRAYRISGRIYLFDLVRPNGPTREPPPIRETTPLAILPASPR